MDDESRREEFDLSRRDFLKYSLSAGVVVWAGTQMPGVISAAQAQALFAVRRINPVLFPQSVASGDPQQDGIVLWTRVGSLGSGNQVAWEIARENTFRRPVLRGTARTSSSRDNIVKVQLTGRRELRPFTTYYYRFIYNGNASRTGRFKTLPTPNADVSRVRFGYISCQDYTNGYYTALSFLSEEKIDYVLHLGDYIYETVPPPGGNAFQGGGPERRQFTFPRDKNGDEGFEATSLRDYRFTYKKYRSDRNLQRVHERYAFITIWDDHEFTNDCYGASASDQADPPRQSGRRSNANRAWAEYQPVGTVAGLETSPNRGKARYEPSVEDPTEEIEIYRSFAFGNLMDLVMTDERLYRSSHPCGEETVDKVLTPGCAEIDAPNRTMLGDRQKRYFINKITRSPRTWKIWGNETMIMQFKVANTFLGQNNPNAILDTIPQSDLSDGVYFNLDQWDGYQAERREISREIAGTENFVVLTGDIHTFVAGYVKRDYDNPSNEPPNAIGTAFVGGSVTSSNLLELALGAENGGVGNSSRFPRLTEQTFAELQTALLSPSNPHFEFLDSSTHGYNLIEVKKDELICTMKAVRTTQEPQSGMYTLARFRVPAGQVEIQRTDVPATAPTP